MAPCTGWAGPATGRDGPAVRTRDCADITAVAVFTVLTNGVGVTAASKDADRELDAALTAFWDVAVIVRIRRLC